MNDKKSEGPPKRMPTMPHPQPGPGDPAGIRPKVDQLHLACGQAINAYATLEWTLCDLFRSLAGLETNTASIIFYKIVSTRARTSIIEKLMKLKYRAEWQPDFWTFIKRYCQTMLAAVTQIDLQRNEIVHWHVGIDVYSSVGASPPQEYPLRFEATLFSPQNMSGGALTKTIADMDAFHVRCDFLAQSLMALYKFLENERMHEFAAWRDIFSQPLQYPPSSPHPLFPMYEGLRTQLAASRK